MSNQNSNPPRHGANNKMLIDATHPEETRVVVLRNGRVEEFDFESAARKLLRGNIYLAKVTRVEPSLQAAFVDYGGNRHGFLAFNEIHPDYYQIPIADRRALIEAETAAEAEEEAAADRAAEAAARRSRHRGGPRGPRPAVDEGEDGAVDVSSLLPPETVDENHDGRDAPAEAGDAARQDDEPVRQIPERNEADPILQSEPVQPHDRHEPHDAGSRQADLDRAPSHDDQPRHDQREEAVETSSAENRVETVEAGNGAEAEQIETVSTSEDVLEEVPTRPRRRLRSYKIQEVIKRRQVLLVQVVKEERGTKGAALTTYLSLAGRYTVLMPNTARGGGISRKINNPQDRKRLKAIAAELDVPEGMGLIIRTAGAARTKQEIKRDYEYLLRLWESVRELALGSNAPALVYEEGNLIKRSIRDLYGKEVEEVVVAGEDAFREARDFMRMLMPSHAKNVLYYEEPEPLFTRFGMERQLTAMFSPYVHLRSGGYLVINQTEALVAIDINSGKSTREFSIEETALSTNLEAADEIARQLKLRDLAGLIVIDFIDMEEKRNNRAVERRLKDALRHDRARIQLGRISHFGLLEMSRQRMRTGVLEGSTTQCPHCQGTGIIRSTESVALAVLRGLEDALISGPPASLVATTTATVALYILNHKRSFITEMETRYGITVQILSSEKVQGANFTVDRQARREEPQRRPEKTAVNMDWGFEDEDQEVVAPAGEDIEEADASPASSHGEGGPGGEGRRRRRRRRGRRGDREGAQDLRHGQGRHEHGLDPADGSSNGHHGRGSDDSDEPSDLRSESLQPSYDDHRHGAADPDDIDGDNGDKGDEDVAPHGEATARDGNQGEGRRRRRRGRRGGRRNMERERGPQADANGTVAEPARDDRADDSSYAKSADGFDDRPSVPPRASGFGQDFASPPPANGHHEPDVERTHGAAAQAMPSHSHGEFDKVTPPPAAMLVPASEVPATMALPISEPQRSATPLVPAEPPAPAPEPPPTARSAPVASEPILERVVVGPDTGATPAASDEPARPARRGWWQRR